MSRKLPIALTRVDQKNANEKFTGKNTDENALTTDATWQLQKETISGSETITEFAANQQFTQIYANRDTIFGPAPFNNGFSLFFDGVNDYLDIADNAAIDFDLSAEAFSCNLWMRTADTTASVIYLSKTSSNTGYTFELVGNRLTIEMRATGTGDRIRVRGPTNFGTTINDGNWHMLTCTYDGSSAASGITLYHNATSLTLDIQNDTLTGDTSNAGNAAIAADTGGSGGKFGPGHIDEPAIWDAELSAAQVTEIYNAGVPIDLQTGSGAISASLNAWWRMGDGPNDAFPNIEDVESTINGTMTNMTAGDIQTVVPS